ncbi:MAG: hypothetical protein AAF333_11235 [Planctomycetota bacterium]
MSHHAPKTLTEMDTAVLGEKAWPLFYKLIVAALAGLIVAAIAAPFTEGGWKRLGFAYLIGYAFALAIALGCFFFVIITTLFRAGWCVAFRRVPETIAASMPTMGVLAVPVLIMAFLSGADSYIYPWSQAGIHKEGKHLVEHSPEVKDFGGGEAGHGGDHHEDGETPDDAAGGHAAAEAPLVQFVADKPEGQTGHGDDHAADHAGAHGDEHAEAHHGDHHAWTHTAEGWGDHSHATPYFVYKKGMWYTPLFWVVRLVFYIAVWSLIAGFFWKRSVMQDEDGDVEHTHKREWWAPLSVAIFALTVTMASFDLILSLDPVWYSTMYGVYFFAGCFTAGLCTIIITLMLAQRAGYFPAVTAEHFHDLGKLLFAFVFFWGYVGFSQFMLIWYASLPETTYWWEIRGVTSVSGDGLQAAPPTFGGPWTVVSWTLLFAHLLLPFAILLSKHVKRNRTALFTMACWMLTLCYVDLYWVIMPSFSSPDLLFGLPEIGCLVFCVGVLLAQSLRRAKDHRLAAHRDPRMYESLGLDTSAWAPLYHK